MLDPQRTRPLLEASMSLQGSCWWVLDLRVRRAGRGGAVAGWAGAPNRTAAVALALQAGLLD